MVNVLKDLFGDCTLEMVTDVGMQLEILGLTIITSWERWVSDDLVEFQVHIQGLLGMNYVLSCGCLGSHRL